MIKQIIAKIAKSAYKEVEQKTHYKDGLYSGDYGLFLFLQKYSEWTKDVDFESISEDYLEYLISGISEFKDNVYTFCDGLSGVLYLFQFLEEQDIVTIDFTEYEGLFEEYLVKSMNRAIEGKHFDFMHGAIGIGTYFLKRNHNLVPIHEIIDFLDNSAEKENHIYKWKSILGDPPRYDISLAHGISSIVLFLARVIRANYEVDKAYRILSGAINYILSQELDIIKYGSYFPPYSKIEKLEKSRLGWCYGDLGIGYALWYAGKVTNHKIWEEKGLSVLLHAANRRSLENNFVFDAGICHGSAGIAMIFRHMYLITENESFLSASNYWIDTTVNFLTQLNDLSDYVPYKQPAEPESLDWSLLMGLSGIGLMLLSYYTDDKQLWDEMLLL